MATELFSVKGTTARRRDPACGTCRKKCRKCDRTRPICNRCRSKGLHCEGYPPRFQFCEMTAPQRPSRRRRGIEPGSDVSTISQSSPGASSMQLLVRGVAAEALPTSSTLTSPEVARSPELALQDEFGLSLPSPPSIYEGPSTPSTESPERPIDEEWISRQALLHHFEHELSGALTISIEEVENPFRELLLPLAFRHDGVLHALLGFSACHMHLSGKDESQHCVTAALHHRASALHSLGSLLIKEEASCLSSEEEEFALAMVLLLVFHDICETGVSSHGAHLTGVLFLCTRIANPPDFTRRSKAAIFFISALSWLDMLRGFSGAEKLAYSEEVRQCVRDHGSLSLHLLVGCPVIIFHRIGQVLEAGKAFLAHEISEPDFKAILDESEKFLRGWDPDQAIYPTAHPEWKMLAEAYRHACLLRVIRFPDTFGISCDNERVRISVSTILDVAATIPRDSTFYKRLLFPLFLAGADTSSSHQIHYTSWSIAEIKASTGFQHPAMTELLTRVWEERKKNTLGWTNIPWMEFTCSTLLQSQHAYLFF